MVLASLLLMTALSVSDADVERDANAWHEKRLTRLKAEDGWLSLVALLWLEPGTQTAGSASDNKVVFPLPAPPKLGTFAREGKSVTFTPEKGVAVLKEGKPFAGGALTADSEGKPDVLQLGSLRFNVIVRGERVGLRVKDAQAKTRLGFQGIARYPARAAYRVEATFTPATKETKISVPTVLGTVEPMPSPGTLRFTLNGKALELTPVIEDGESLFVIFADETNKSETYGAGRFLYSALPKDGKVTLDFNQAYNPPCAFSKFATCPLPPKSNRLPIRVEAGEKRFGDH
ncbi:MAG: DUF1684 domain-containing protein [Myxococcaceae bacterium]